MKSIFIFFILLSTQALADSTQEGPKADAMKSQECSLLVPEKYIPNHRWSDERCDFLAQVTEDHKKRNTPQNGLFSKIWGSYSKPKAYITVRPGVFSRLNKAMEGGGDIFNEYVILDEKPEADMLLVFVKRKYDALYDGLGVNAPDKYYLDRYEKNKKNRHDIIMFSVQKENLIFTLENPILAEQKLRYFYCSFIKEPPKPIGEMTDVEIRVFYQAYVQDMKQKLKDGYERPFNEGKCWPVYSDPHNPYTMSSSYSVFKQASK